MDQWISEAHFRCIYMLDPEGSGQKLRESIFTHLKAVQGYFCTRLWEVVVQHYKPLLDQYPVLSPSNAMVFSMRLRMLSKYARRTFCGTFFISDMTVASKSWKDLQPFSFTRR